MFPVVLFRPPYVGINLASALAVKAAFADADIR